MLHGNYLVIRHHDSCQVSRVPLTTITQHFNNTKFWESLLFSCQLMTWCHEKPTNQPKWGSQLTWHCYIRTLSNSPLGNIFCCQSIVEVAQWLALWTVNHDVSGSSLSVSNYRHIFICFSRRPYFELRLFYYNLPSL